MGKLRTQAETRKRKVETDKKRPKLCRFHAEDPLGKQINSFNDELLPLSRPLITAIVVVFV